MQLLSSCNQLCINMYTVYDAGDVLLDDIAGPDGDPLVLKETIHIILERRKQVVSCPCALRLNMPTAVLVGIV
ncbi:hypothetical protein PVK06_022224 [Gossypium arboreum]|uniref:Uncharacterized protein n=1 Tax=Gossypium arboreum TaxID=29729 RepID=A0ABR0P7X1_GOSAR|nr:hypothetical protein PVK06_022224 [Gossypium arboreum]